MTKKRGHGEGSIDQRGENNWRLRYRINGKRFTKPFRGTKTEAQKALRQLLHAGDTGSHVTPDKLTFGAWAVHWLAIGAPSNRRRRHVGQRSLERYTEVLRCMSSRALAIARGVRVGPLWGLRSTSVRRCSIR